jgi:hypothetical protein
MGVLRDGYLTAEMLPEADPDQAAAQAARYLLGKVGRGGCTQQLASPGQMQ